MNCWHGHKRKGKEDIPGILVRGRACVVVAIYNCAKKSLRTSSSDQIRPMWSVGIFDCMHVTIMEGYIDMSSLVTTWKAFPSS